MANESNESNDSEKILYIQADGSMVPIKGKEEKRYKEVKLGLVYTDKDVDKKETTNKKNHY